MGIKKQEERSNKLSYLINKAILNHIEADNEDSAQDLFIALASVVGTHFSVIAKFDRDAYEELTNIFKDMLMSGFDEIKKGRGE